jgi:hypothetical protein
MIAKNTLLNILKIFPPDAIHNIDRGAVFIQRNDKLENYYYPKDGEIIYLMFCGDLVEYCNSKGFAKSMSYRCVVARFWQEEELFIISC